jgi:adenosylcobinamide-phosphate synthase
VYLAYAGLALGQLLKEGRKAARLIESGNLAAARQAVGWLVSRDTTSMGVDELRRTLAETLSENVSDGFVCPLFYLCIGGPVGLWAYKAVSTMDSMWGYRTERYNELGWACARMDDVLAYIPARLTMLFLLIAGACLGLPWRLAWAHAGRDARQMESPNAGWPMAACAWLLGAGMGGTAVYFGKVKQKPALGPHKQVWSPEKLATLLKLLLFSGFIALLGLQLSFSLLLP